MFVRFSYMSKERHSHIHLDQGRRTSLGSRGLSPGTFSNLLNGSFFQIAQKCNKNVHQKIVPPKPRRFFWGWAAPDGTKELAGKSQIDQNCKKGEFCLNVEEFHEFFNSAHLAIQREQDHSKAKVYQQWFVMFVNDGKIANVEWQITC